MRRHLTLALLAAASFVLMIVPAVRADGLAGYIGGETSGFGPGELSIPRGMALNQTGAGAGAEPGDLYIADDGEAEVRIDQFSASGAFVRAFGWGVIDGSNAYQICTTVCHGAVEPSPPDAGGSIGNAGDSVAIDQSTGNVFVSDGEKRRIDVFNSSGGFEGAIGWGVATETSALEFCTVTCHFGSSGSAAGQMGGVGGLGLDPTTGNLYVADAQNDRVDEFSLNLNGSGEVTGVGFVLAFGWGVDTGAEAFETCTTASTCQAGMEGEHLGELTFPGTLAVNSAGVVYVPDSRYNFETGTSHNRVEEFTPSGGSYIPSEFAPALLTGSGEYSYISSISVASNDHVFVNMRFPPGTPCPGGATSEAEARFLELTSAGSLLATHGTCAGLPYVNQVQDNAATGTLYADSYPRVYIFAPTASPIATINSVTPNTSGATVTGTVNPNDPANPFPHSPTTSYQVEYKRSVDSTWSKFLTPIDIGGGASDVPVSVHLGGLQPNTSYEVRLVGIKRGAESGLSATQTFVTLPVPPSIEAFSSSGVTATSAELHALINPHGTDTTYHFEYGTTPAFGHSTPETDIGSALETQSLEVDIDGLEPVTYYFRVVAKNSLGTTTSGEQTFSFYPPACPNAILRQQSGTQFLPDCRAYELVSPSDAGDAVLSGGLPIPAPYATSPARFGFGGKWGAIPGSNTIDNSFDPYVATRTNTGWVTKYVGIPGNEALSAEFITPSLNFEKFIDFKGGFLGPTSPIPYVWDFNDNFLGRWPADFTSIPDAEETRGAFQPSPDFSHLAFSSNNIDFDPGETGLTTAPGSAYDYDAAAGTTKLISRLPNGSDIPQLPGDVSEVGEYIRFPALHEDPAPINPGVSTDGSHILMSTYATPYEFFNNPHPQVRLYLSVNDAVTYEVSTNQVTHEPADVDYLGMTANGKKVFFTSSEQLTAEDEDTSVDIYMWSEEGEKEHHPLTLISKGDNAGAAGEPGNSDACVATWTEKCDASPIEIVEETDNPIAAEAGDIYFYSPELLDGPENGLEGAQNLYVYRSGQVEFVALLSSDGSGPVTRIQVSPNDEHAAFVTASKLTAYENAGRSEMYSFDPSTGGVHCVSCIPSGEPPSSDVEASQDGLFMSNDGRIFWSTDDALVRQDTDRGTDVYEYVDGRPQLITSGVSAQTEGGGIQDHALARLQGVTADGINAYFSTYDSLVAQDHNGPFLKFYDARTDGGFPAPPAQTPCVAADECHAAGDSAPPRPAIVSTDDLGPGGNANSTHQRKRKHQHRKKHRHKRRHKAQKGHVHRSRSNG